jgi:high-affinity iron transporter
MFLNSVILILQEFLEAALLISVLLVLSKCYAIKPLWVIAGIGVGAIGALLFALNMAEVSEWFDYVGQEVVNALIQLTLLLVLGLLAFLLSTRTTRPTTFKDTPHFSHNSSNDLKTSLKIMVSMILAVSLAITREGSEIFIYIGGVINQPSHVQPTLAGSGIGAGIGISTGILIYYGLLSLPTKKITQSSLLLLALVGGNMASQATLLLTQADWLPYSKVVWDSSTLLQENSVVGHLLYALIGYEATPSLFQFLSYLSGVSLILLCWFLGKLMDKTAPSVSTPATAIKTNH